MDKQYRSRTFIVQEDILNEDDYHVYDNRDNSIGVCVPLQDAYVFNPSENTEVFDIKELRRLAEHLEDLTQLYIKRRLIVERGDQVERSTSIRG